MRSSILTAVLVVASSAVAADNVPPELLACAAVSEASERLACYDHTIQQLSSRDAEPEQSAVSARVKALRQDAGGALLIELDNGQQWRQTSGSSAPLLEVGHEVTITRAALGSYRMSTPSGRALKVKRVL